MINTTKENRILFIIKLIKMKKYLFKLLFVTLIGVAIGYNIYNSEKQDYLSDLALSNIEALANGEIQDLIDNCYFAYNKECWYLVVTPSGNTVWYHWNMNNKY